MVEERNNDIRMGIKMLLVDEGVMLMRICGNNLWAARQPE